MGFWDQRYWILPVAPGPVTLPPLFSPDDTIVPLPQVRAQPTSLQKRWPPATSGPLHLLLPVLGHWQGSSRDLRWPQMATSESPGLV